MLLTIFIIRERGFLTLGEFILIILYIPEI
jgi:hypothetical protein